MRQSDATAVGYLVVVIVVGKLDETLGLGWLDHGYIVCRAMTGVCFKYTYIYIYIYRYIEMRGQVF